MANPWDNDPIVSPSRGAGVFTLPASPRQQRQDARQAEIDARNARNDAARLQIAQAEEARRAREFAAKFNPDGTPRAPAQNTANFPEQQARIITALDNLNTLDRKVSSSDMGVGSIVGQEDFRLGNAFLGTSGLYNQTANDVAGSIEMVQGDLINQVRNEMNQSGAPIGARGADTEKEASRLAASIANLAQTQDEGDFRKGIARARDYYTRRAAAAGAKDMARVSSPELTATAAMNALNQGYRSLTQQMQGKTPAQRQAMLDNFNSRAEMRMLKQRAGFRDPGGRAATADAPRKAGNVIRYDAQGNRI